MAKAMTKTATLAHLAEKTQLSKKQIEGVLDETLQLASREAKKSGQFVLPGFGKLVLANRKARIGRNPNSPATDVPIPERSVVKFKPGKEMREAVLKLTPDGGAQPPAPAPKL